MVCDGVERGASKVFNRSTTWTHKAMYFVCGERQTPISGAHPRATESVRKGALRTECWLERKISVPNALYLMLETLKVLLHLIHFDIMTCSFTVLLTFYIGRWFDAGESHRCVLNVPYIRVSCAAYI